MSRADRRREQRAVVKIPRDHGWKAREGFQIVVADRGVVRFDVPRTWHVQRGDGSDLMATDKPPPDDDGKIQMSVLRVPIPPGEGPPLLDLLRSLSDPPDIDVTEAIEPILEPSEGAELGWSELHFVEDGRDAISRTVLARGGGIHALFTMVLWADDRERFEPAWEELRHSIEVGKSYDLSGRDPRRN